MRVKEIYQILQEESPFENQESWDNCGLQVGDLEDEVERIVLALEVDWQVVERLEPKSLLIVHHPLIFKGLKQIETSKYPAMFIKELIKKECVVIAMHTNFDFSHLNAFVAKEILGFKDAYQEESVMMVSLPKPIEINALALQIKKSLQLPTLKLCDGGREIKRLAIVCGSGFSLFGGLKDYNNLCFLTGDIKYHDAMLARAMGVSLIDIMHYESECNFVEILKRILQKRGYKAIISETKNPFIFL